MKHRLAAAAALAFLFAAAPAAAQAADSAAAYVPAQAISILPLHAAFGFYAGDYERAVGQTVTAGLGGSYFSLGGDEDGFRYSSVEAKVRYYPSGDPLNGLSFGLTAGPTFLSAESDAADVDDDVTAVGIGFEIARSHLMGVERHFYYGYGAGFKRLFMVSGEESGAEMALPTLRLSIGYAF
ncbi:MAG TPA: hypothetical protein VGC13_31825 [Longimicrobium sp.]|uniref:hypothetical protein n=1 Tax=Longimicrobium sp. TaxID=2029185 RepID=UPI002EDB624E